MPSLSIDDAVDIAVSNIKHTGFTDIFGITYEVDYITPDVASHVKSKLKKKDINQLELRPIEHVLLPKSRMAYDYRRAALICPLSTLYYLSLAIYVAPEIESRRIPESNKIVFSYRFKPNNGNLFSDESGYNKWLERHKELKSLPSTKIVVSCDIAGFYDRLNLHRLQSALSDAGVETWTFKLIDAILTQWAKKDSYGLPIGSNASRILAEAALLDIDNYLLSEGVQFIRFVDDFKFYAPDPITAQKWITLLVKRLFKNGLTLNAAKTKLRDPLVTQPETESVDGEKTEQILKTVVGSKYNKVPRRFKMPKSSNYEPFKSIDLKTLKDNILSTTVLEFYDVQKFLIASIVQQNFLYLEYLPDIMERCMFGIDYMADMLEKNCEDIPREVCSRISDRLAMLLRDEAFRHLDWHQTRIIRLLSIDKFFKKDALLRVIRTRIPESSSLPSLTALEGLRGRITRSETYTIRDLYDSLDDWSKRRMLPIVTDNLLKEEADAWLRSIPRSSLDPIHLEICRSCRERCR